MELMPRQVPSAFVLLLLLHTACSQLPPGWEDELFCPSGHCLRKKAGLPKGFVGARSAFVECISVNALEDALAKQPPIPWGSNYGDEARQSLIADGYHTNKCTTKAANSETILEEEPVRTPPVEGSDLPDQEEEPDYGDRPPDRPPPREPAATSGAKPAALSEEQPSSTSPAMLVAAVAVALLVAWAFGGRGSSRSAPPTTEQKANMELARKQRLDKLAAQTEQIRETDEWKAREKAAKTEAAGVITPEQRRAAAGQGRCGGDFAGNSPGSVRSR